MKRRELIARRLRAWRDNVSVWRNTWISSLQLARIYRREPVESRLRIVGFVSHLAQERAMARPMVFWWRGDRDDDLGDFATTQERAAYHAGAPGPFRRLHARGFSDG